MSCMPSCPQSAAVAAPFDPDHLFREVTSAAPYRDLSRADFDRVVDFVATGGYALRRYERHARLKRTSEGRYRIAHPRIAQQYRLNIGTIVEAPKPRGSRLVRAASFRFRPILPNGSAPCWRARKAGPVCPRRCATGFRCNSRSRACPGPAICLSRPFPGRKNIIWCVIRYRRSDRAAGGGNPPPAGDRAWRQLS